jgi:hypothetical protein
MKLQHFEISVPGRRTWTLRVRLTTAQGLHEINVTLPYGVADLEYINSYLKRQINNCHAVKVLEAV